MKQRNACYAPRVMVADNLTKVLGDPQSWGEDVPWSDRCSSPWEAVRIGTCLIACPGMSLLLPVPHLLWEDKCPSLPLGLL